MPAKYATNIHQPAQAYWRAVDIGSDSKAPLDTSLGLCLPGMGNRYGQQLTISTACMEKS